MSQRPWLVGLLHGLVRLYFPRIEVSHRERVPAFGPVVVVANHPNGLLDPMVLQVALGRPLRFLGKSTFWDQPVSRFAVEGVGALPVYRAHEADTSRNEATFAACRQILADGGWMALFPEGTSHSATALLPLKSGAARIALSAAARAEGLRIVPVGLLYEDKAIFRTGVGVVVGHPIPVAPLLLAWEADPHTAATALTARIAASLGEVVLQADGEEIWRGLRAVAAWTSPDGGADTAARDRRALTLAARARSLAEEDPEQLASLITTTRRFVRVMDTLGVHDPFAVEEPRVARTLAGLVPVLLLAPFAAVGAALAWLPYRAVRPLAVHLAHGQDDVVGTIKLLAGVVLLVPTWLVWTALAGFLAGPLAALTMFVFAPLTGLAALRFDERLTLRREALAGWLRSADPRVVEAIRTRRRELARLVEAALESPPAPPVGGETAP